MSRACACAAHRLLAAAFVPENRDEVHTPARCARLGAQGWEQMDSPYRVVWSVLGARPRWVRTQLERAS